jgi:hypothetical protein
MITCAAWLRSNVRNAALAGASLTIACSGSATPTYYTKDRLTDPQTCKECHPQQYADWSGSMHAYASDDPLFVAMNQRGQDQGHVGSFCVKCHAPLAFQSGKTTDGTNLAALPQSLKGVTCYFCHNVDSVQATHPDAALSNDPLHLAGDNVMRAGLSNAVANKAHPSAYSALHDGTRLQSAQFCGSCHDVVNDHGAHIERTFAEWSDTLFNSTGGGSSCAGCHMNKSTGVAANAPGVFVRTVHDHKFPGVDLALEPVPGADPQQGDVQTQAVQDFLRTELATALCVEPIGTGSRIVVVADNIASGHNWPSGAAQDRRAWFQVVASTGGAPIYQSGVVPAGTDPADGKGDDDLWLLRDCMLDGQGAAVHTFWDAVGPSDSNTLPGAVTSDPLNPDFYKTHIRQTYPRAPSAMLTGYPDTVTLDVYILAFPPPIFDDLFATPSAVGLTEVDVASLRSKLVPLSVGQPLVWSQATAMDTSRGSVTYFDQGNPVYCVTAGVNPDPAFGGVAAPKHTSPNCKP